MIVVPLQVDGVPCHNCGQRSRSITVNVHYLDARGKLTRANRINPCGCLLNVTPVIESLDSREVRHIAKVRH